MSRIGKDDIVACDRCGVRGWNLNEVGKVHDPGYGPLPGTPGGACGGTLVVMNELIAWALEQGRCTSILNKWFGPEDAVHEWKEQLE